MNDCEVCKDAAFVNVEAVNFHGDDCYLKPSCFCFEAIYCPRCGRKLKEGDHDDAGN